MKLQKLEQDAINNFKQSEKAYREFIHKPIYVGNGIWDQIKEPEPIVFKVEDLYEGFSPHMWPLLDALLEDRKDLRDRIEKYKKKHEFRRILHI